MSYNYANMANAMLNQLMPTTTKRQIISVNGIQEAKNYVLERGENIILMDSSDDIIYIKSVDDLGKYQLKAYQCTDITDSLIDSNNVNINKSDIDKLSSELADLRKLVEGMNKNEYNARKQQRPEKSNNEVCQ